MDASIIARIRSFNRTVTQRTGALDSSYLGRGRPLGEARLLSEIARSGGDMRALRERLGLDSGYFSRLVRALERQGLVATVRRPGDGRRRDLKLTQAGEIEHSAYDALSDGLARSMVAPLDQAQRERLVAAMAEVERLLIAGAITISQEPLEGEAARRCVAAYFEELAQRFEEGFDPQAAKADADISMAPPTGCFLVARLAARPVGCGGLRSFEPGIGEIKRMWVAPEVRGMGLARRLLDALESEARGLGMRCVRLDTNRALAEAQAMYRKAGYREIPRFNDNPYADFWFEKSLRAPDPEGA